MKDAAEAMVEEEARAVIDAPWPDPARVTAGVIADDPVSRGRVEILERDGRATPAAVPALTVEERAALRQEGHDVPRGRDARRGRRARRRSRASFVFGEDVGGKYGNAFLLLRPLLEKHGDRIVNSPLAEGARARRVHRIGAGRAAADRRDAVQRFRRDRLQPARQQRGQDPLPLGRAACRWSCACRGAGCGTRARTIRRTPSPGSIGRPA